MSDSFDQTANLLGALALLVTDRTVDAVAEAAGQSQTAAVALSALHHFLDQPTVDRLRQVLGLTSSGTVRLVDRLEQAGYVTRGPGADGRATLVSLTEAGRTAAERVSAARAAVLSEALATLTPAERDALGGIAARLLAGLWRGPEGSRWTCRWCDTETCGHDTGDCPFVRLVREAGA